MVNTDRYGGAFPTVYAKPTDTVADVRPPAVHVRVLAIVLGVKTSSVRGTQDTCQVGVFCATDSWMAGDFFVPRIHGRALMKKKMLWSVFEVSDLYIPKMAKFS